MDTTDTRIIDIRIIDIVTTVTTITMLRRGLQEKAIFESNFLNYSFHVINLLQNNSRWKYNKCSFSRTARHIKDVHMKGSMGVKQNGSICRQKWVFHRIRMSATRIVTIIWKNCSWWRNGWAWRRSYFSVYRPHHMLCCVIVMSCYWHWQW